VYWLRRFIAGPVAGFAAGLAVGVFVLSNGGPQVAVAAPRPTHAPAPGPPPSAETVTVLMNEEVAATLDRDIISQIYAPDAFVEDAACGSPGITVPVCYMRASFLSAGVM
jgi:hypothetical protein